MSSRWIPIFVLPNVVPTAAIGCEIAALAPPDDPRVANLKNAHPSFRSFLNRFSDNFGQKFEPSVLILNDAAPADFRNIAALASFRDLIAISAITHGRATKLREARGHRILFGESFAIYPWMLDRDYDGLIGKTPALMGMHLVSSFKGQSSPALFRTPFDRQDIDQPLLAALMQRWRRRYERSTPDWEDVALMRSLNMAYHASLMPAGIETTFYDVGRLVSLWVSAFEILVHPGGDGKANRDKVFHLIERTSWAISESRRLAYDTGDENKPIRRTLASWLYHQLNKCRNDFLHGNPVEPSDLSPAEPKRTIFDYAAPLYRIALTPFLPLVPNGPPSLDDPHAFGAHIAYHSHFIEPQKNAEKALLTAAASAVSTRPPPT